MAKAYGFAGHIGLAKETSGGTPVAVTDYVEAFSENFALTIDRVDMVNIAGRLSEPDDFPGISRIEGQLVFPFHPANGGHFLRGAFNVQSTAEVQSGELWQHIYTPAPVGGEFGKKFELQPYTFEIFRDADQAQQYSGVQMSSIEFNITPNQDLRCTVGMIGTDEKDIVRTVATFPTSPNDPFAFDTASISIGGVANADLESLTITFDNQLEGIGGLSNTRNITKIRRTGFQMVRIAGDIAFEDVATLDDYRSQTERSYTVSMFRANSFQLTFEMPRVVLNAYPIGITGRDRVIASFEGMGRFDQAQGTAMKVVLTTTKSDF